MTGRVGLRVICTVCDRRKKPVGRDSRDNGLCDHECPGWHLDPQPDYLWPGELEEDAYPPPSHDCCQEPKP